MAENLHIPIIICIFALEFDKYKYAMEKKLFKIYIEAGDKSLITFDAVSIPSDDDSIIFCRYENDVVPNMGMIRVDRDYTNMGLLYDIFTHSMTIDKKEEVAGNLHLVCTSNLLNQVDVYIADIELWMSSGKAIFS